MSVNILLISLQVSGEVGVDEDCPLSTKLFDLGTQRNSDVSMLARRWANMVQNQNQSLNITINMSGLADLIHPHLPLQPIHPSPSNVAPSSSLPPKMTITNFCRLYDIADEIRDKLIAAKITGPHAFRRLTDDDLKREAQLVMGEVCDVRDGENRWLEEWQNLHA